ncbi:hypothetical protein JAAARDRAFT_189447 [Jaapia argillacea MUCL 33604]|uniref:DNA-directed RNA polymerase III subunit RPC9 n=1 Tax=Jaapia argillacea MUCL 33604 TaxID=933084 RepID=A0A067Q4T9_9AGAM|nr:hypothetical protein JAAARDRAFT_189447 [Jaapia argillacea MUCL 33604]
MEVLNPRSALLSNFEVLTLLKDLEADHLSKSKTALRIKKEEEQAGIKPSGGPAPGDEICENLRTVEVETIQYLTAPYQPTASQTEAGITKLVKDIAPYGLTKAEKLQIVNLVPTEPVELYVIVEELEDRLAERMDEVLSQVRSSLTQQGTTYEVNGHTGGDGGYTGSGSGVGVGTDGPGEVEVYAEEEIWVEEEGNFNEWDDMGEGAGVEGDLEMDEE